MKAGKDAARTNSSSEKLIQWSEWALTAAFIIILVIVHLAVLLHSGGLWRDEVNSINISHLPSIGDIWAKLAYDSFPALWFLLLRFWSFIGLGETDLALRTLGLLVSLGIPGAFWYAARSLGMRLPMISLALFAMCPTVLAGDSLRAYGLGSLLIMLALAAMWRVIDRPTRWRMFVCAVLVILSAQCLYNNAFLILAICLGAAATGLYRRDWKLTLFPIGAGALAALSLLPYFTTFSIVNDYNIIRTSDISLSWILNKLHFAMAPSGLFLTLVWDALALLTVIILAWQLLKGHRDGSGRKNDMSVFLLTTLVISVVAYIAFIKVLALPTQSWYYLPLMAVMIIIIDKGIDLICLNRPSIRIIRIVVALIIAVFVFTGLWDDAHVRKTNMDGLAAKLEALAGKNDLIVVTAFYYGISFERYYKGSTPWVTLPDISDHSVHRYDLFKDKMTQNDPIGDVLQKITETLQNGHRVWVVGPLNFLPPGQTPRELPPAPNSLYGWSEGAYQHTWSNMAASTLRNHGRILERIFLPEENPVNSFENLPLLVIAR